MEAWNPWLCQSIRKPATQSQGPPPSAAFILSAQRQPAPGVVPPTQTTTYQLVARNKVGTTKPWPLSVTVQETGELAWKRDIVYLGGKEVAEFDAKGMHVTQVDHLGSPRIVTNKDGVVESMQKFTPFGEQVYSVGSAPAKGFTNHEQTDPSGLIYMQARYYLPMYGRFGSPDPAMDQHFEETQSWNINSYVQNNPVMNTDPTGMLRARFDPEARDLMDQEQLLKSLPNRYEDNPAAYKAAANEMRSVHNARGAGTGAGIAVHAAARGGSAILGSLSAGLAGAKERVVDLFSKAGDAIGNLFSRGSQAAPAVQQEVQTAKSAYDVAVAGGKHAGFLKNYLDKPLDQIQKGVGSIQGQITEHLDKIQNPSKYIENFYKLDPRQQQALVNQKWPSDIARQREQLQILQELSKGKQ